MKNNYIAVDEAEKVYLPELETANGSINLTLKKETFKEVKQLRVLPGFAKAKAGDEGFFITPRNIEMNGDLLVRFSEHPDAHHQYEAPIMSCLGVRTPEVCALVRIERNY